jgi:hypothetical protein
MLAERQSASCCRRGRDRPRRGGPCARHGRAGADRRNRAAAGSQHGPGSGARIYRTAARREADRGVPRARRDRPPSVPPADLPGPSTGIGPRRGHRPGPGPGRRSRLTTPGPGQVGVQALLSRHHDRPAPGAGQLRGAAVRDAVQHAPSQARPASSPADRGDRRYLHRHGAVRLPDLPRRRRGNHQAATCARVPRGYATAS